MTTRTFLTGLLLSLSFAATALAQVEQPGARPAPPDTTVTVSISANGVRFAALGGAKQVRLEVFGADGASFYNSDFQPGSVRDWKLEDGQGQRLPDGDYLCVVTVRSVSGRLSVRQGNVLVQGGQATLQFGGGEQGGPVEPERALAPVAEANATSAFTLLAHDGRAGQLVTTSGDLSFRGGDFFTGRDKELMRLSADGSLEVTGALLARGGIRFADGTVLSSAGVTVLSSTAGKGAKAGAGVAAAAADGGGATASATANRLAKFSDSSGANLSDSVVAESNGFVGLGTATPASLLHLAGAGGANAITLDTSGTHRFRFQTVPNVANWGALTLNANFSAGWRLDDTATNGWFFKLDTRGGNNASELNGLWLYRVPPGANPHTGDETAAFGVTNGRAYFRDSVGIGTTSPQAKLDVAGNLRVAGDAVIDGNIAAKYQDVAEWVPGRGSLPAGTVVVLDRSRVNGVTASSRAYSTHVAGVVSARPGLILGEAGDGKVMVATTGRVRVRVDATRRPVRIGDLLVTSERPGVAMRSLPLSVAGRRLHRPGTIIGKALEALPGGRGEILVLLSMQ